MPGRLEFDLGFGRKKRPRDDTAPMRLLVLGDFSGGARDGPTARDDRTFHRWTSTRSTTAMQRLDLASR